MVPGDASEDGCLGRWWDRSGNASERVWTGYSPLPRPTAFLIVSVTPIVREIYGDRKRAGRVRCGGDRGLLGGYGGGLRGWNWRWWCCGSPEM